MLAKIIHIADLHIGHACYRNKKRKALFHQNFTKRFDGGLIDVILKSNPDALLIAGDIFDGALPSFDDLSVFDTFLKIIRKEGIEVIGIIGNHDRDHQSVMQADSFFGLCSNTNGYQSKKISGAKITMIPHMSPMRLNEFMENEFEEIAKGDQDIICMHQSMYGFLPEIARPEITPQIGKKLAGACRYIALGDLHIHKKMIIDECIAAYPGTVDFLRVGEPTEFGVIEATIETGAVSLKTIKTKPTLKTTVFKCVTKEDLDKLATEVEEAHSDFFVIGIAQKLEKDSKNVLKLLEDKNRDCETFCYRSSIVGERLKVVQSDDEITETQSRDFMEIIQDDQTITEEDKEMAAKLWQSSSTRQIQSILAEDLKLEAKSEDTKS